jgi:hypothetical protein
MTRKAGNGDLLNLNSLLEETEAYYHGTGETLDEADLLNPESINAAIVEYHSCGGRRTVDPPPVEDVSNEVLSGLLSKML